MLKRNLVDVQIMMPACAFCGNCVPLLVGGKVASLADAAAGARSTLGASGGAGGRVTSLFGIGLGAGGGRGGISTLGATGGAGGAGGGGRTSTLLIHGAGGIGRSAGHASVGDDGGVGGQSVTGSAARTGLSGGERGTGITSLDCIKMTMQPCDLCHMDY